MRAAFTDLAGLVAPLDVDDFFVNAWERAPHLAVDAVADVHDDILTLDQFDQLAAAPAGLSIVQGGIARPADDSTSVRLPKIYDAYRRGCTLLQAGLQFRWPSLALLCRTIENDFIRRGIPLAGAVGANGYLTPGAAQGFDLHHDSHCAFILQLHGAKRWSVFAPIEPLPIARCERPIPREDLGEPLIETDLHTGDVLYIPRGFPHAARTDRGSSLHVTLSVQTLTWADVAASACHDVSGFRRSVRVDVGENAIDSVWRDLATQLTTVSVADSVQRRLAACLAGLSPLPGRLRAIDDVSVLSSDTALIRSAQVMCAVDIEAEQAVLRFPGATLRLPLAMKPVFEFIATHLEFAPRDLPAIDGDYDAVELSRILVRQGLVGLNAATWRSAAAVAPAAAESV